MSTDEYAMKSNGMIDTQPMQGKPTATEQNFQQLHSNVEELFDWVHKLGERIQPILTEGEPSTANEKKGYPSTTPVAERLGLLCSKTDDLIDRLKYLTGRVDL